MGDSGQVVHRPWQPSDYKPLLPHNGKRDNLETELHFTQSMYVRSLCQSAYLSCLSVNQSVSQ